MESLRFIFEIWIKDGSQNRESNSTQEKGGARAMYENTDFEDPTTGTQGSPAEEKRAKGKKEKPNVGKGKDSSTSSRSGLKSEAVG